MKRLLFNYPSEFRVIIPTVFDEDTQWIANA